MSQVLDLRIQPLPTPPNKPPQKQVSLRLRFKLPRVLTRFNYRQPLHWLLIGLMLLTVLSPVFDLLLARARYDLRAGDKLLSNPSPQMAAKISYDAATQLYQFNKAGIKKSDQSQPNVNVGGDSKLYSADLPVDAGKGIKIYDNVNNLTVGFAPQFRTMDGKQQANRLVYPLDGASPQLVYTAKANGLEEDLVLPYSRADQQTFRYQLDLGSELEAREVNGGVGIYSADPTLFGNISFGSDSDRQRVEAARKNGQKTNLVFFIPEPTIKQSGKGSGNPTAKFSLNDDILTLTASNLRHASYPLSIDPSFIVTSSTDLRKGNNEGVDFDDTNNQILRPGLTGGTVPSVANDASHGLNTPRNALSAATWNNCLYALSGATTGGSYVSSVEYTTIDSSGNLASWQNTSSLALPHIDGAAVAYNGYLYELEGDNGTGGGTNDQNEYAKINSDCTLGSWATTTILQPNGIGTNQGWRAGAYNGYIYVTGGWNGALVGAAYYNTTFYAKLSANGTIGTWNAGTNLPEARHQHGMVIYNGFLYVAGGDQGNLSSPDAAVKYVKINSDGSLGSTWFTTTSFPVNRLDTSLTVANGYMYTAGGQNGVASNDVLVAPIYTNGSIGGWQTTGTMTNALYQLGSVTVNGYVLTIGGNNGSTPTTSVQKGKIDAAGVLGNSSWTTSGNFVNAARLGLGAAVYNGYLYAVGGCDGTNCVTVEKKVDYAPINADGSIGTWANAGDMVQARAYVAVAAYNGFLYAIGGCSVIIANNCTSLLASTDVGTVSLTGTVSWSNDTTHNLNVPRGSEGATVYNGYLYAAGGNSGENSVEYALLNNNGTLNNWTKDTDTLGTGKSWGALTAWNGYLYFAGGNNGATYYTDVLYSTIGSSGNPSNWTTLTSTPMSTARAGLGLQAWNGYLYDYGGRDSTGVQQTTVEYTKINSDGTLAGWNATTSMSSGRYYFGSAMGNGVLYAVGGFNNSTSYFQTGTYQVINNGGQGGVGTWTTGNTITARGEHGSVVVNGYLYVMGGCVTRASGLCKGLTNGIQYAAVKDDGSLGSWSNATNGLTGNLMDFKAVGYNGRIYVAGGCTTVNTLSGGCTANTLAINFTAPAGNGDINGSWTSNGNLPGSSSQPPLVAYNGYMYALAANNTTNGTNYYAAINASTNSSCTGAAGLICSFSSTSSLNTARDYPSAIYYNGYIYVVGGTSGSLINGVEYAKIDPTNHTLGTWTQVSAPWIGRQAPVLMAYDGNLCLVAGYNPALGFFGDTWCVSVLANGAVDGWQGSTKLSQGLATPGGAQSGGTFYVTGGENGSVGNDVQSATNIGSLRAITRAGHYSRVLDSDVDVTPTKLVANGSMAGADTLLGLSYAPATNSGNVFDAATSPSLTFGTPLALTTSVGGVDRYYFLDYSFDDNQSAIFPDSTSIQTTLTDFTLYYHAASSKRLRGGKTFTGQTQQSLDASP